MHRWLLLVMVLLLPLRGLAGVAMAGQMLEQHVAAPPAVHGTHHASAERPLHDCDEHHARASLAAEAIATEAPAAGEVTGDCPTCASCQACSALVLAPGLPLSFGEAQPQAPPALAVHAHASAEPALDLKPPRS